MLYAILPFAKACRAMGFSRATGERRLRDDPEFPETMLIGPNRRGIREDKVIAYQKILAKRAKPVNGSTATQLDSTRAKELVRLAHAKRQANKVTAKALAESRGAASPPKKSLRREDVPGDCPARARARAGRGAP